MTFSMNSKNPSNSNYLEQVFRYINSYIVTLILLVVSDVAIAYLRLIIVQLSCYCVKIVCSNIERTRAL